MMYYQHKYIFPFEIISGNRITIPHSVVKAWDLKKGDELKITFELKEKDIKGIVL